MNKHSVFELSPSALPLAWLFLALPALYMTLQALLGALLFDLTQTSGQFAFVLVALALSVGPLTQLLGTHPLLKSLLLLRRSLGVSGFGYAVLHFGFYLADMGNLSFILAEISLPSISTGYLSFALLLIPACISSNYAQRVLKRRWIQLQRLVYPAYIAAAAHWILITNFSLLSLSVSLPVALLWLCRITHTHLKRKHP